MRRNLLLLAVLVLILSSCPGKEKPAAEGSATGAPVILISIDTLRADHLPAFGYTKVETPNIDALRHDGILYSHAYSHVPLTLPSHVSILTGLLPPDNGVRNNIGFPFDSAAHPTIPTLLKEKGYATGAAVSAYVLRGNSGLSKAFDFYEDNIAVKEGEAVGRLQRGGGESEEIAEKWIGEHSGQPFFFFLHLFEPHSPYDPPEPFRSRFAPYDGEIAAADAVVGKLIASLKSRGLYDKAVIILLSDHGEGLNQHGEEEHGIFLYAEDIHVPLILKLPGQARANGTVADPVQLTDVLPTITSLVGATNPPGLKGRSLLATGPVRRIYSETLYPRIHLGWSDLRSFVDDQFHYIEAPRPELYKSDDAAETANVLDANRRAYASMRTELQAIPRGEITPSSVDPEEAKKLAALGYLSGSSSGSDGPLPDPKDRIGDIALMKQAARLEGEGRSDEAIAAYRELIAKNPRLTDAWTLLATRLEKVGRYEEAADTYKRAIQLAPSIAGEFSLSLANLYLMLNRPDEAAAHAQLGLRTNPANAHLIMGRAALSGNHLDVARSEAEQVLPSFNYRAAALVLLAQIDVRDRKFDEASQKLDQAVEDARQKHLEPPPLLFFTRGDILARLNRMPEAIESFEEELRRFPHDRQAYANLAVIHLLAGHPDLANKTMERLVTANPGRSSYEIAVKTFEELHDAADAAAWRRRAAAH